MSRVNWQYQWARKFSASRFEVVMRVFFSDFYKQEFGARIANSMVASYGKNHVIYHDPDEWNAFAQPVFAKACSSLDAFYKYKVMIETDQQQFVKVCQEIVEKELGSASPEQLSKMYEKYDRAYLDFFNTAIWIPFIVEPLINEDADAELKKLSERRGLQDRYEEFFDAIFLPEKKNAVTQEREDLLKIVQAVEEGGLGEEEIRQRLEEHTNKYCWIPCYDIYDKPWTEVDFKQSHEDASQSDWQDELQRIKDVERRHEQFVKALDELQCDERLRTLFTITHELTFIKDERDDFRRRGSFLIQPFFIELGKRMGGLSLPEVSNLISTEVRDFFQTGALPLTEKIKERVDGYVLKRKDDSEQVEIYSGQEAEEVKARELAHLQKEEVQDVKGIVGSNGVATGPARLVITKHDLRKVEPGDIMVAVTTHPDYVPAMRRCAAIVTDEGGLTCHAAIVARELQIPCIVGTKLATATFQDGEILVLDAENGSARKVE
ncbi:PEP-utilizing enzyme [Patescibacteria group bacterium]